MSFYAFLSSKNMSDTSAPDSRIKKSPHIPTASNKLKYLVNQPQILPLQSGIRRDAQSIADSVNKNSHSIFFIECEGEEFSRILSQREKLCMDFTPEPITDQSAP